MKTPYQNKLLIAAFAIISFMMLSSFLNQETTTHKYLTLRTIEIPMGVMYESKIIIVDENGKTEESELGKHKESNFVSNTVKINEVINNIANKGYKLIMVSGTDFGTSTYTFEKE